MRLVSMIIIIFDDFFFKVKIATTDNWHVGLFRSQNKESIIIFGVQS